MPMPSSDSLREATIDRIAAQWIALGCQLASEADSTVLDMEALVAVTAELAESDPRVYEAALDWCLAYGQAINTSRLRTIAAEMTIEPRRLAEFSGTLARAGGPTWPSAAGGRPYLSRGKVLVADLTSPSRLLWRIRAAFGVNARADILAALLTMTAPAISVAELAHRTRFTKRNIAQASNSMRLAGVIEIDRVFNEDRVKMAADSPLRSWLYARSSAPSVDWPGRWRVVIQSLRVLDATQDASLTVRAVEGRASLEGLLPVLSDAALPLPNLSPVGPEFAVAYDAWIAAVESRFRSNTQ
jgi:hypothetical protein